MKLKKITLLIAAVFMTVTSCLDEHVEPTDMSLKIGNVFCANSSIVPVDYYLAGYESQAVGVIIAVGQEEDDYKAIVMALEDLGKGYYLDSLNKEVENVSIDPQLFDGKQGTSALVYAAAEDNTLHPQAAFLCSSYAAGGVTGWHLPSVAELRTAMFNSQTIYRTLDKLGAQGFHDDWYQTCTADGSSDATQLMYNYVVTMPEGRVTTSIMTEEHYVRPFLTLK